MSGWDGSGDQYVADIESKYPLFSDIQTTDESIVTYRNEKTRPRGVNSYESKYQSEQMGVPTYMSCNCGSCPSANWPREVPLQTKTIDQRLAQMEAEFSNRCMRGEVRGSALQPVAASAPVAKPLAKPVVKESVATFVGSAGALAKHANLEMNTFLLVFMFIAIVFICMFYTKALCDLKSQIKLLRMETKKQEVKSNE
jgi:hypothetical protein